MRERYKPGSLGWLWERGICVDCVFAPASRVMTDPTCSPPLPYCERCIREINEARESDGEPGLLDTCYDCGGSGRYDDVVECPTCGGEGTVEES